MHKFRKASIGTLILLTLLLQLTSVMWLRSASAASTPQFSVINPGPSSYPSRWNASSIVRDLGTANFKFYSNETSVYSTFFANITVTDVTAMFGWGIGIVYDNTTLRFMSAWLPTDNVFKGASDLGYTIIKPSATDEAVDASHHIMKFGATFIQGSPEWSFNGTGTMCQVQFMIMKEVNQTHPLASSPLSFDPDWTTVYYWPSGQETPLMNNGNFVYRYPIILGTAVLAFNPSSTIDPLLIPPSSFDVNITIAGATNVFNWSLEIYYDRSVLNATNTAEGAFLSNVGATSYMQATNPDFNATHAQIILACTLLGGDVGAFGDGLLATIAFDVIGNGSTPIVMTAIHLYDPSGTPISFTKTNGYFSNVLVSSISVEPPEVRDPSLVPGQSFSINITITNVQGLKKCIFNLTYDPTILQETQVTITDVQGQTPSKKLIIDDDSGFVWANITYPSPITVFLPVRIAMITFLIKGMGVSPLNLEGTYMEDGFGNSMSHEVNDGIFIGLIRDVSVEDIVASSTMVYQGWLVNINVTVKNLGNLTESFGVEVYYDGNLAGSANVSNLDPNLEQTLTIVWNTTSLPCANYTISAKADLVPYEFDTTNNFMTDGSIKVKLMGDINNDDKVDMSDVMLAVAAFGSFEGHPRWNPNVDLDQNGLINMGDIIKLLQNFGKQC